ncbi:hypothetical protein CARUB_v10022301mg [Capsella rubella]|uniref:Pectinesterase inhibitor domain-containing protein n=1 Tax=Capsella rubella TaxID=81985 RepID=R0I9D6_9BRAS|nr:uncharacterized protein LOC17894357 [Capsella rubella]EOA34730.1 hypothetical protein CARUB_v10022301mg [Capsella rubella]
MSTNLHLATAVVVLLLLTASQSGVAARRVTRGGRDPCSVSDFKVLCRSVVKGQKNVNAATEVSIRELMKRTIKAKEAAKIGRKSGGGLKTCYSNYDSALDNLQKALKNIKQNDGFSLNINLSASLTDFDTCNDAMAGGKGSNVFAKSTSTLHEMADNCLALSTLVKQ